MALDPEALFDMTRSGLNRIQQALSIYDRDLKLAISNRRFQEMFGLPDRLIAPGSLFSDTIYFLARSGDYGEIGDIDLFVSERVEQAMAFEPHYVERTRSNGMVISVEGSPVRQGGWVTVYTDITPIKRQEALLRGHSDQLSGQLLDRSEALARTNRELGAANTALEATKRDLTESEARARVTAEMTPAHIARVGLDQRYTYSNRKLPTILSGGQADIIGKSLRDALGAEAFGQIEPHLKEAYLGQASAFEFDLEDGARRLRVAFTPDDEGGEVTGAYILSMDVTEEAQARVALAQARKRELAAQLANGLAHDFSNLLTVIVGLQSQIEARTAQGEDISDLVQTTKQAALRGGDLLERLSDISGGRNIAPSPVLVEEMFARLESLAKAAVPGGVSLVFEIEGLERPVVLDQGYTQDALLNLIINASDAVSGHGEITVSAKVRGSGWLDFSVRDDGSGFSAAALERAIDPFFTTKAAGKGTGLGLTMVYDFAKLCGGRVRLENLKAGGARVVVSVPRKEVPLGRPPGLVLLVEDTEELRHSIRQMLRDQGHTVLEADSGEEALALAALPNVSFVVSDLMLKGEMTGLDLGRSIRESRADLPVFMVSGLPAGDPVRKDASAAFPLLKKPFSPAELALFLSGGDA